MVGMHQNNSRVDDVDEVRYARHGTQASTAVTYRISLVEPQRKHFDLLLMSAQNVQFATNCYSYEFTHELPYSSSHA